MTRSADIDALLAPLPGALRVPVLNWLERFDERHGVDSLAGDDTETLLKLVGISEFAGNVVLRQWETLAGNLASLGTPDLTVLDALADADPDIDTAKSRLRIARNRQLLGVLWREVAGLCSVEESIAYLSDVADRLLLAAANQAEAQMLERFGRVRDADGNAVPLVVIGMGKLGGRELNFSSDIDIVFAYPSDGESDGRKSLNAQPYFDRMSRHVVAMIDDVTADGFVHRTDTRLRPFGDSGPPVVSFAALESYLLQHGRDWERYAWVKARAVGPRLAPDVHADLFEELVLPFVYRRYLDYGVFESLRDMHSMIAAEVERRELADNVKLGPGGIREIEFIVQSLQLVRGGGHAELKTQSLLQVLPRLVAGHGMEEQTAKALRDTYLFLRRLENFIQAIRDKQTHDLPSDDVDRARLCLAMGVDSWDELVNQLDAHRQAVADQFRAVAFRGNDQRSSGESSRYAALWAEKAGADEWQQALEAQSVGEAADVARRLVEFQGSSSTRNADTAALKRLAAFVPRLLEQLAEQPSPDTTVDRCLGVIEKVLRRSAYIALLNENRVATDRLVSLCAQSAYISREIAEHPVLLDELLDPRLITGVVHREDIDTELDQQLALVDAGDSEGQMEVLARVQQTTRFRVAVADVSGALPLMKVSDSLTFLAEAILERALAIAWRDLVGRHGAPQYEDDEGRKAAGFGIVAYGKLGGLELSYGSDLDIVFLHDSSGRKQVTDGEKPLDNALFFSRLVRRLVHILTTRTRSGVLYEIDTRLRPSGRKGLLVTNIDAFERYQDEDAWTWEHQALLRARPVAGSPGLAARFEAVRDETLRARVRLDTLRDDVLSMRTRMRDELDKTTESQFDMKQGEGGIGDIEFLVQFLVLSHAADRPALIEYSDNIRQLDALTGEGLIEPSLSARLQDIYRNYRQHQHRLVLNDEPSLVPADSFAAERDEVRAAWQQVFGQ